MAGIACASLVSVALATEVQPEFHCIGDPGHKACFGNLIDDIKVEGHEPLAADRTCRDWCSKEPCSILNGNLTQECSACSTKAICNPLATDYAENKDKTTGNAVHCLPDCITHACEELYGNPQFECGGCEEKEVENSCHPGAPHFDDWIDRIKKYQQEL